MPIDVNGIRTDSNPVPLWLRETWTLPQAAQVFNVDYQGLRLAAARGDVDTFRPPNKRGDPGRRHVRRDEMLRWVKSLEE